MCHAVPPGLEAGTGATRVPVPGAEGSVSGAAHVGAHPNMGIRCYSEPDTNARTVA